MKISIITASYNQAAYLPGSLNSVSQQTHENYEHIIHDAVSNDGSQELLRTYAAGNPRVRLVIEKDGGQVQAINNGLAAASGEVLTWLNTDDFLFDSEVLAKIAKEFEDPGVDVVYGRGWYVDERAERVRDVYVKRTIEGPLDLLSSLGVFQPALYFRRRVFDLVGGLNPKYQLTLDYEYWIRMLQNGVKFKFIDHYLAKATLHNDSKTVGSRSPQLAESLLLVKDRYGYVHPDWIDRFINHFVNRSDWTSKDGRERESKQPSVAKVAANHTLCLFADKPAARLAQLNPHAAKKITHDLVRRIIVTSFDANYYAQGLNLIASIHAYAKDEVDRIVIYDLGLTVSQRGFLASCEGVVIEAFPEIEPWTGYFSPKSYMYKCYAIQDAKKHVNKKEGEVLWVDAGVCVTSSLMEIFNIISAQGVFIVNHDDRNSKTMINACFTHPMQTEHFALDLRELTEDHVCSCVLGYGASSIGLEMVELVYQYSLREDINRHTKHPEPKWLRANLFEQPVRLAEKRINESEHVGDAVAHLADFPYYGHRQDQSLYSNVAARMALPVSSALRYCPATDYSSKISFENWKSGGEAASIERSGSLPEGHMAPLFHHRGTFSNLSGLVTDRSSFVSNEIAFVLGNGPSLKSLEFTRFRNIATVGMNAAYRYWDDCGWYPSYYCCMDTVVILSHAEAIYRLIDRSDTYGIRLFFLRKIIADRYPELNNHPKVLFLEDLRPLCPLFQVEPITTGSYSLMFMAFLGFKQIYLAGVDCNYVERIAGIADGNQRNKLVVVDDVKVNPNYFFDSYQRAGDEYNVPNPSKDLHVRSWRQCARALADQASRVGNVRVINLNQQSKVDCFENASVASAIGAIDGVANGLAKNFVRTFRSTPNTPMIRGIEAVLAVALGGSKPAAKLELPPSVVSGCALKTVHASADRFEIRLLKPVALQKGNILTAVFELELPSIIDLGIHVLHLKAWDVTPRVTLKDTDGQSFAQTGSPGLYVLKMTSGRGLLLINLVAARAVNFEGLSLVIGACIVDPLALIGRIKLLSANRYESQVSASLGDPGLNGDFESSRVSSALSAQSKELEAALPTSAESVMLHPVKAASAELPATAGSATSVIDMSSPGVPSAAPSGRTFSEALREFRAGRYEIAGAIAAELARKEPDFKWYSELAKDCERRLTMRS